MDLIKIKLKAKEWFTKYKYVALVVVVGLFLILWPGKKESNETISSSASYPNTEQKDMEAELSQILSRIKGAGKVEVMLTVAHGEEIIYQSDTQSNISGDSSIMNTNVITVTNSERNETGLIRQINPPAYLGAVILCQGADSSTVRLAIIDAVSKVTGLGTDKISVIKMK